MNKLSVSLQIPGMRVSIVASRFNELVVSSLISGCEDTLRQHGVEDILLVSVPGAFEIPLACKELIRNKACDAIIALGVIIRGGTPHFEYLATQSTRSILQISVDHHIPIGYGILTVENLSQALERAGSKQGNKGREAALAAIEMLAISEALKKHTADR